MRKTHLINLGFFLAIMVGLAVLFVFILPRLASLRSSPQIAKTPDLVQEVQTLSQLVTVKYVLEKVIIFEDPKWYPFGESRVLMVAHGIVKAGVDLSEIRPQDMQVSPKKIVIKMPPARITDTYLDDKHTEVIERTTGLLRTFDKDLEQNARKQAVDDINRAARNGGILKDADERARSQLIHLFQQMGYTEVEFRQ
ncbi:MAG: hypothetical protein JWR19_1101 [Pedosphaera sp.]|nr:hypothetical protein [Pedosphaera sp.]